MCVRACWAVSCLPEDICFRASLTSDVLQCSRLQSGDVLNVCVCVCVGMYYVVYISVLPIKYSSHLFLQGWIYGKHIKKFVFPHSQVFPFTVRLPLGLKLYCICP